MCYRFVQWQYKCLIRQACRRLEGDTMPKPSLPLSRRELIKLTSETVLLFGAAGALGQSPVAEAATLATLPFENGERPLVAYPQKRPLLRLTTRPPQLETPFPV